VTGEPTGAAARASAGVAERCHLFVVQPSPFCNLDCDYCYLPDRGNKARMSEETLRKAFERLFESGLAQEQVTVVWHAGEPLAVPVAWYERAWEVIEAIRPRDLQVDESFQTNATLIDDRWCDYFLARDSRVGVSVDGPAWLNDRHRKTRSGRGTFERVARGMQTLRRRGVPFHVISVLSWDALEYPDELYEFYVGQGIDNVGFNVEEKEGTHGASTLEREGVAERYRRFLARLLERVAREPGRLRVRETDGARDALLSRPPPGAPTQNDQADALSILNVAADGSFSTYSPELLGLSGEPYGSFALGNVHREGFRDVLSTQKFLAMHGDIRAGVEACRAECPYFAWCGGGAPANKHFENGTMRSTKTLYCTLTRQVVLDVVLAHLEHDVAMARPRPTATA
jgi:uncharacterized protein